MLNNRYCIRSHQLSSRRQSPSIAFVSSFVDVSL